MIYASSSVIVGTPPEKLWEIMKEFIKLDKQGKFIVGCQVLNETEDSFERTIMFIDGTESKEKVTFLDSEYKIIMKLEDHPLLIGDTVLQIITSSMDELNDRKSTLCGLLSWRMRPGIIEAPLTSDKQDYIEDVLWSMVERI